MSTKTLKSEQVPVQLPAELLPALVRTKRVLLCLDYDGTISEIVQDPALARPVPGVPEVLAEFVARRDRIAVAIVSGREVATLQRISSHPAWHRALRHPRSRTGRLRGQRGNPAGRARMHKRS